MRMTNYKTQMTKLGVWGLEIDNYFCEGVFL